MNLIRSSLAIAFAAASLSACGKQIDPGRAEQITGAVLDGYSSNKPDVRSGAENLYKAAGVLVVTRENTDQTAGLGLLARNGDTQTWSTLDGTTLTLKGGMVIGTSGFGPDLFSVDVDAINAGDLHGEHTRIHRYVDGENHVLLEAYLCKVTNGASTAIRLNGRQTPTLLHEEACTGSSVRFVNKFYFSKSGGLLTSKQWIGEEVGYLTIQMPSS